MGAKNGGRASLPDRAYGRGARSSIPSVFSLAVLRGRRVRLKYGYIFYAHPPVSHLAKSTARFVVEIFRQVLCRGIEFCEWLKIIDHLMIEPVNHMFQHLA